MIWTIQPRSKIANLAVIAAGHGPLVVLLHGVGLRSEAWSPIITDLAENYRILAVDLPGHGESEFQGPYSRICDYAQALLPLLQGPCALIGHSMGALIALELARRYPDVVWSVAALNAVFERSPDAMAAVQARAAALEDRSVSDPTSTLLRWFGTNPSAERAACSDWLSSVDPKGYKSAYTVFASVSGVPREALKQIKCPSLFLTGEQEPNSTPAMSKEMAALAPHGRAEVVPDAGHMMPMTHARSVAQILVPFLQETLG